MLPRHESQTVVWTDEMACAFGLCRDVMLDNQVQARLVFRDAYTAAVARAREQGKPVSWTCTLGHDVAGRTAPLLEAEKAGRLTAQYVAGLLPYRDAPEPAVKLLGQERALIEHQPSDVGSWIGRLKQITGKREAA